MPTKNNAPKQGTGNGSKKKQVAKKINDGPGRKQQDPPIVVGGGNSVYVWMLKSQNPTLISPSPTNVKHPANPDDYLCYKLKSNIKHVTVDNGSLGGIKSNLVDPGKHSVQFDE